ncbi:MAG: hypothetical protein EBV06_09365 [Planctomycetia bacterium]|nr:hypothetical protein [Planctomycetia bacterium]
MRARTIRGAWWLAVVLAFAPGLAHAQEPGYAPPSWPGPFPLGSTRPEEGGLYLASTFSFYSMSNPLKNQKVAVSGFRVFDNSLPGFTAGDFVGPGDERLNVQSLRDDMAFQPGFTFALGWKFRDGSSLELNWMYLNENKFSNGATLAPQNGAVGADLARSFLYADVYNIPLEYSGPPNKIAGASPFAAFGLWNGASVMTQSFRTRFQTYELSYKWNVIDEEYYRMKGIIGPRFAWFWDKYKWTSVNYSADGTDGGGGPDTGIYTNIVSNRMYGVHAGTQCEQYLGHGWSCIYEGQAAALMDVVKERAKFETGEKYGGYPESKYSRSEFTFVPQLQGSVGLMWFPWENVQLYGKYEGMVFFNTISAPRPVEFDYLRPRPNYESTIRWMHGWQFGAAVHF